MICLKILRQTVLSVALVNEIKVTSCRQLWLLKFNGCSLNNYAYLLAGFLNKLFLFPANKLMTSRILKNLSFEGVLECSEQRLDQFDPTVGLYEAKRTLLIFPILTLFGTSWI